MSEWDQRDKSRTVTTKSEKMRKKNTTPPSDQGGWIAVTMQFLESAAYQSLSLNARRALDRLKIEHISHGRRMNGSLIVPHGHFRSYGVTADYVADALDELTFKGFIKMHRGRAGNGTAHPTVYTLTFDGTKDGLPPTHDWKKITASDVQQWSSLVRKQRLDERSNLGRKKNPRSGIPESARSGIPEFEAIGEASK